jgi:hypothetical protein
LPRTVQADFRSLKVTFYPVFFLVDKTNIPAKIKNAKTTATIAEPLTPSDMNAGSAFGTSAVVGVTVTIGGRVNADGTMAA